MFPWALRISAVGIQAGLSEGMNRVRCVFRPTRIENLGLSILAKITYTLVLVTRPSQGTRIVQVIFARVLTV
jgi:hypothetical protein